MWKFLRRLFIVLILLLVAFVVYRFINPDGASRLVDKIKSIPASIGIGSKNEIEIESETTFITGDVQEEVSVDEKQDGDLDRLKDLNKEIEEILWQDKSEVRVDESILVDVHTEVEDLPIIEEENSSKEPVDYTWVDSSTWVVIDTWTSVLTWEKENTWYVEPKTEVITETKTSVTTTKTAPKKQSSLSNFDYQQILNVFGNLFK